MRGGGEEIMLDGNALAEGRAYFRIGGASHSPDHRLLAWSHDDAGSEFFMLSVRDLEDGSELADVITDTSGGAVWSADGRFLFYVRLDANHRPSRVFRHKLGTSPEADVLVYEEADPGFFVSVGKTKSRRFVLIHAHDHQTSEVRDDPRRRPGGSAAPDRAARGRGRIQCRRGERHVLHPDQCRNERRSGQGFSHRHRAGRGGGTRELGRSRPA